MHIFCSTNYIFARIKFKLFSVKTAMNCYCTW